MISTVSEEEDYTSPIVDMQWFSGHNTSNAFDTNSTMLAKQQLDSPNSEHTEWPLSLADFFHHNDTQCSSNVCETEYFSVNISDDRTLESSATHTDVGSDIASMDTYSRGISGLTINVSDLFLQSNGSELSPEVLSSNSPLPPSSSGSPIHELRQLPLPPKEVLNSYLYALQVGRKVQYICTYDGCNLNGKPLKPQYQAYAHVRTHLKLKSYESIRHLVHVQQHGGIPGTTGFIDASIAGIVMQDKTILGFIQRIAQKILTNLLVCHKDSDKTH
ncbi:hypothetical protein M422DRAFT_245159 [Sphaerobolus stellatus SS14]|nr:hypothetical protein M422DRAFT_245159 [Sphaerobolus stellatus SS14]